MSDQFWLTKAQLKRIEPFFPRTRGIPRVDDRRVVSGIIYVIRNGLRWRDAPAVYGPHKTLYNRFVRRPLRLHILRRYLHRGNRYLLARSMSPDPSPDTACCFAEHAAPVHPATACTLRSRG
jgi:transposase